MAKLHSNTISSVFATFIRTTLAVAAIGAALTTPGNAGQPVNIVVDQARIMRLSTPAATIIVGNPMIADVSIQDNQMLVVMGKSNGLTNMIALDENGREIANVDLIVQTNGANSLTLYKGSARISMNCSPRCEQSLIVGDAPAGFETIEKQLSKKMSAAKSAARFSN